ncbi:MAG: polysaccharide deacetylase family protein, partial [Eubacteriales bacterium]
MYTLFTDILIVVFTVFLFYILIPEILLHLLGIGTWRRQYSPGVTLTFDDGPDPRYTPKILDLLKEKDIKATFFLIGEKAEKYPELVRDIIANGHLIGCHCYKHRHAWTMLPSTTFKLWDKGLKTLKGLTGQEPLFIRPPWGCFTLSLFIWCKIRKKKAISWNAKGYDWNSKQTPSNIIKNILRNTKEGSIILLHDSGGDETAPLNTILALEELSKLINDDTKLP